ncbi:MULTISPECIES: GNAT family N-acetyltransferase [Bacillaceae]|uniref:GNAT family N-acetyltransferase n=1 Tax=Bacillaceae TaxID=186817 RepID=UPI001E2EBBE2|nr:MULTISPECIES: GNAT family N-acetyltransferase [Bacillaceae]MCE4049263.1 GNAT family N-acetyltransferase [Bacillus sp. Au-Bac7]MCM3033622.1 GNAT family N-acetyltransferase [Niallia sp. MER 6]
MTLQITREVNKKDKQYIEEALYKYNLSHFPKDLGGRFEEICLFLKDDKGTVRGGILSEVCWNWLEIHTFMIDEDMRKSGYGTKLLAEVEKIAVEKDCDFIKVDTLSFQALGFYEKNGYQVYGTLDNVGREHKHYYLKKELKEGKQ